MVLYYRGALYGPITKGVYPMKKLASLFLALALCLGLCVPALADAHVIFVSLGNEQYENAISSKSGTGWSYDENTATLTLNGIKAELLAFSHFGANPTIVLAPGSKNTLSALDFDSISDTMKYPVTIKGTGELIISNPSATENGVFSGFCESVKLLDGLTMTGGTTEGGSGKLTLKAFPSEYYTTYRYMAGDKPATYIRIAPAAGAAEKPAEPQKPAAPSSTGFTDVPDSHYAAAAIQNCVAKGITSGYSDGTFKPAAPVTRAQFCVMIARAFYPDDLEKLSHDEMTRGKSWFTPAVMALFYAGPYGGILDSVTFAPNDEYPTDAAMNQPISRYDMAHIAAGVLRDNFVKIDDSQHELPSGIGDRSSIPAAHASDVAVCYNLSIIGGQSDGTFGGNNTMNRAQACVVIDRMARLMDSNTPSGTPAETPEKAPEKAPAETPAPSGTDLESMRQGVLELVNAERSKAGKSALSLNSALCGVAQLRADEIVKSFSHTRPNGSSCFTAIQEAGISYGALGENIAAGQSTPASVMDSWMNSEGHRANILSGDFTSIGIGYVKASSGYGHYWVQMFLG